MKKGKGILAQVERGGVLKKQKSIKSAMKANSVTRTIRKLVK